MDCEFKLDAECMGASWGHGRFSLSGDFAQVPIVWCDPGEREESYFLSQGSPQKGNSRAGLWVWAPAKHHLELGFVLEAWQA